MAQAGWPYAAIGREETISRKRVRRIVAQASEAGAGESKRFHARAQYGRLEPALRLAAQERRRRPARGGSPSSTAWPTDIA